MFPELEQIHRPSSLDEALGLLDEGQGQVVPLAGGTATGIWRRPGVRQVVDLWGLGLDQIEPQGDKLYIGATVTVEQLLDGPPAGRYGAALAEAAVAIASTPIRNLVTVGGNLCAPFPWSDLPVVLLALGAQVNLRAVGQQQSVSLEQFLQLKPRKVLDGRGLLVAVRVPTGGPGAGAAFETLTQTDFDYALVSAAAAVKVDQDRIVEAAVAIGAVESTPRLVPEAAAAAVGQACEPATWGAAGSAAAAAVKPRKNPRAGAEYRRSMTGVLVERALERAASRAQAGRSK